MQEEIAAKFCMNFAAHVKGSADMFFGEKKLKISHIFNLCILMYANCAFLLKLLIFHEIKMALVAISFLRPTAVM